MLTPRELQLLDKLALQGKPTKLAPDEVATARELATVDLVFIARGVDDAQPFAVITPKGRHAIQKNVEPPKRKPPLGFLK